MANKKISELTALGTTPANDDVVPVVDTSTSTTKSVTVSNLLASKADSSHTHAISDVTSLQTSLDAKQATVTAGDGLSFSGDTLNAEVTQAELDAKQAAPSEGAFVDGDKTKLDGIETSADLTDATNVEAAGALMDSELTDLAGVKGVTISTLQPKPSEGAFADGDKTKLDGIAASSNNYSHPNHSGEVTSTGDGATVIADDVVDEANLKVSNAPTDGYSLVARSGETGGLKWESVSGGGGGGSGTVTSVGGTGTVSGLTLSGTVTSSGDLTLGGTLSVDLTSDVTGNLPDGNISSATTWNGKQDAVTAGTGLSFSGATLNAEVTQSEVDAKQDTVTAGTGLSFSGATLNAEVTQSEVDAKQDTLTFGIANTNAVKVDAADVADDEYARFTANGLESRSGSEVLSDIGAAASAHNHNSAYLQISNNLSDVTASTARTNLGLGAAAEKAFDTAGGVQAYDADTTKNDVSNTWTAAQQGNTQTAAFSALSSGVLDFDTYQNFVITLGAGTNAFTNPTTDSGNTGQTGVIVLIQDSSASTATWTSDYKNVGGSAPTLSSGSAKVDVLPYIIQADNTILLGAPQLDFS